MNRFLVSLLSFFIILGLYFLYGWVAVPLVLPPRDDAGSTVGTPSGASVENEPRPEMLSYLDLFPENSWEWNPKVEMIRDSKTVIVFLDSEIVGNKAILKPCTILFLSDEGELSPEEQIRRSVVLRTPDYAEIEFDDELNFSKFPLPKIVGGKLFGDVTIQSDMERPDRDDDLHLETRDIAFKEEPAMTTISTVNEVRFRLGPNRGQGTMLSLEMALSDPKDPKSSKTLSRVQFETLQFLSLCFPEEEQYSPDAKSGRLADGKPDGKSDNKSGDAGSSMPKPILAKADVKTATDAPLRPLVPLTARAPVIAEGPHETSFSIGAATTIDVRCQREFSFQADSKEPGGWIACFYGNVHVVRTNPDGMKDHVHGEELQISFLPKPSPPNPSQADPEMKKGGVDLGRLEPVKFRVLGRLAQNGQPNIPARVISPQNGGVTMIGDHILYDIRKNLLALETETKPGASRNVQMVLQNRYTIFGEKGFQYHLSADGGFGTLISDGRGRLRGNMGDEQKPQKIDMSWEKMQIEPYALDPSQIQIQLEGKVVIDMEGFGKMKADKLDLRCYTEKETGRTGRTTANSLPGAASPLGGGKLVPDWLTAMGRVHFENANGTCDVHQFQVYFKRFGPNNEVMQSRWLPYIMTRPAPLVAEKRAADDSNNPIRWAFDSPESIRQAIPAIRQVQYQTGNPAYAASAVAAAPGGAAPIGSTGSMKPTPASATGTISSQNLLGFHSGDARSRFAVTADRLIMHVMQENREAPVEHLWLGGNVRIVESVGETLHGDLIEITGNEVDIWKPSTPNTIIEIVGKLPSEEAIFKGKGVQMNAMKVNIFRAENLIWVKSPGRLLTTSGNRSLQASSTVKTTIPPATGSGASGTLSKLAPLTPTSTGQNPPDDRLVVEWNGDMKFSDAAMVFSGKQDSGSGRVLAYHQNQKMVCDFMWIYLNRTVRLFDDSSNVPVEAETIECLGDVNLESRQFGEDGVLKSFDRGQFEKIRIYVKSNDFVAAGPGRLRSTSAKGSRGIESLGGQLAAPPSRQSTDEDSLAFLCVWFQDYIRGNFYGNRKRAEITGRVQTIYCPVRGWDEVFEIDRITAATRLGYYLQCERLEIVQMPDPAEPKESTVELTASQNAKIEGDTFYGQAATIKYAQAKNLIVFDKNAWIKQGRGESQPAQRIEYNTETGAVNMSLASGASFGN